MHVSSMSSGPWLRRGWLAVYLLSGATILGCGRAQPALAPPKPPDVYVSLPITNHPVTDYNDYPGRTEAMPDVQLRARVTGYLLPAPNGTGVLFKEGTVVNKDQVLYQIDPRPYKATLDQAVAQVHLQEAQLKYNEAVYQRNIKLASTQAVSPEELQQSLAQRNVTRASLNAAKANVEQAQLNLDFTKVTSPITGRISRTQVDPGNLVQADQTILTTIVSENPIYAYADVDENSVLRFRRMLRAGKVQSARDVKYPILLALADEENFPHQGIIDFVDNTVDPQTGTLRVRGVFPNEDRLLSPGLFVTVRIPIGSEHQAILVAERALGTDQGQKFVYVVGADNKVAYRAVTVGPLHKVDKVPMRVIESGISPGEKIVVSGLQRVRPRIEVAPHLVKMTEPVPSDAPTFNPKQESAGSAQPSRIRPRSAPKPQPSGTKSQPTTAPRSSGQ